MRRSGIESIHLATQYLAAAGISFLSKKDDDSHSNLGFSEEEQYYRTRPLNEAGDFLSLNLNDFALEWRSDSNPRRILLDNKLHKEILAWMSEIAASELKPKAYQYDFHYELPYVISDDYKFQKEDSFLRDEIRLRSHVQQLLKQLLDEYGMVSEIRTWPHHFDTGAYAGLPEKTSIYLGMGLAIPDQVTDDYYFYISGYKDHTALATTSLDPLSHGMWINDRFTGAILPANQASKESVMSFFTEAIQAFASK